MNSGTSTPSAAIQTLSARRLLALLGAFALAIALVAPLTPADARPTNGEDDPGQVFAERFDGEDRHATACEIATATFGTADTVLLTRSDFWADTLSGNYLAGQLDAPVLITAGPDHPQPDEVDAHTLGCLEELEATDVVIIGGTEAVSQAVQDELEDADYEVERIGGDNRHETAALVADAGDEVGETDEGSTAIVASAGNFPDALVSGAVAYDGEFPLLLTHPDELDEWTAGALDDLEIDHVLIPGGTAAVSQAVQDAIEAEDITTERLDGERRTDTATMVADWAIDNLDWDREQVSLARGDAFPDALALGPHGGVEQSAILLTASPEALDIVVAHTAGWLRDHACESITLHVAGGDQAVSDAVAEAAGVAASDCGYFPLWEQNFEDDVEGWFGSETEGPDGWCGTIEQHDAGEGPVDEPSVGDGYATAAHGDCNEFWEGAFPDGGGPYGLGDGWSTWFPPEGYQMHLDVHLDPDDANAEGELLTYIPSISLLDERPRDWDDILDHVLYYFFVPVAVEDGSVVVFDEEVEAGWYTFSHYFTQDAEGGLEVEFRLTQGDEELLTVPHEVATTFDAEGAPVEQDTDSFAAEDVGSGYIWLDIAEDVEIGIDHHRTHRSLEPVFPTWQQDFEDDAAGWFGSETEGVAGWCGTITADEGTATAAHDDCNDFWAAFFPAGGGPFGLGAGWAAAFPEDGYEMQLDVHLDPADANADDAIMNYFTSISLLDQRDRDWETILDHILWYFLVEVTVEDGDVVVSVGDESHEVEEAGWFTFVHRFTEGEGLLPIITEGGELEVEFVLLDADGDEVFSADHDEVIVAFDEDGAPVTEDTDTIPAANVGSGYIWLDIAADVEVEIDDHHVHRIE